MLLGYPTNEPLFLIVASFPWNVRGQSFKILFNPWTLSGSMTLWVMVVSCWSFTPCQHLRSYQDGYWLVTAKTHGNFIVLHHLKVTVLAPWPNIPLTHIIMTPSQPVIALSYSFQAADPKTKSINSVSQLFNWTGNQTPGLPHGEAWTLPITPIVWVTLGTGAACNT